MPRNSPTGFICAFFATFMGFALIWHIWWIVALAALGAYATFVVFAWRDRDEYVIPAEEVARIDRANRSARSEALAATGRRRHERVRGDRRRSQLARRRIDSADREHAAGGLASKRIVVGYGFWIFLLSDIIMFSAFFADLRGAGRGRRRAGRAGGSCSTCAIPRSRRPACCSRASPAAWPASARRCARGSWFYGAMAATFMLGAAFIGLEVREFAGLVARGAGPTRSAFLSAFFTLVGCHGLHVTAGLLWLLTMMAQVFAKGYRADILRRILCFSLFWHALDIIWVALFTMVYLMGAAT